MLKEEASAVTLHSEVGGGMFVLKTSIQVTKCERWEVGHVTMKFLLL